MVLRQKDYHLEKINSYHTLYTRITSKHMKYLNVKH